jgi:hypothetical protein
MSRLISSLLDFPTEIALCPAMAFNSALDKSCSKNARICSFVRLLGIWTGRRFGFGVEAFRASESSVLRDSSDLANSRKPMTCSSGSLISAAFPSSDGCVNPARRRLKDAIRSSKLFRNADFDSGCSRTSSSSLIRLSFEMRFSFGSFFMVMRTSGETLPPYACKTQSFANRENSGKQVALPSLPHEYLSNLRYGSRNICQ